MPTANSITVANGSPIVAGYLTSFVAAPGDLFVLGTDVIPILSQDSTSQLTLKYPWPGSNTSDRTDFDIISTAAYWHDNVNTLKSVNDLLERIKLGLPFNIDASGLLSERSEYDLTPTGFKFLATDAPAKLYIKQGPTASDWSGGVSIVASTVTGVSAVTLAPGDMATVANVAEPPEVFLRFGLPRGNPGPMASGADRFDAFNDIASEPIPSLANGGPVIIDVKGRSAAGDCKAFRMWRFGAGSAEAWFGRWSTTDANGQHWTYLIDGDQLWFEQSGAPHDTYGPDAIACDPWMDATIAFLASRHGGDQPLPSLATLWMTHDQKLGGWFWAEDIDLTGGRFNMRGHGSGKHGGAPTVMRWGWAATGGAGIIIDCNETLAGDPRPGTQRLDGADASMLDGMMIWKSGFNNEPDSPNAVGVFARGRFLMTNCRVIGWDSDGLSVFADTQRSETRGNANTFFLGSCSFEGCRGFGAGFYGADSNAGMCMNNTAIANWQGGVIDATFLGNDHYNWHIETSPQLKTQEDTSSKPPVYVAHASGPNPGLYFVVAGTNPNAQAVLASTTEPGTNSEVWELYERHDDPESLQVPWVSGMTVRVGGTVVTTNPANRARFYGVYCESGIRVPAQVHGRTFLQFSENEVGVSRASRRTGATIEWDNIRVAGGFTTHQYDNDSDPNTNIRLQAIVGIGRTMFGWERGVNGVNPTSAWYLESLQDDSYAITTDIVRTRHQFESAFFLGPNSTIGNNHNSDAFYNGWIHVKNFRLGEKGASRAIGFNDIPQSGNSGSGDKYFPEQPVLGGPDCWTTIKGKNASGGLVVIPTGYVPWLVVQAITPGTVPANGSVGGNFTLTGVALGDFVTDASYNQPLGDCILNVKVNGGNSMRWTITNPTGSGAAIAAGNIWFMIKIWDKFHV
jgi:hypothetical protein